jgi:hypothetical protein
LSRRQAVQLSDREKGGAIGCAAAVSSKLVLQLPQGAIGQAKLCSDLLGRAAVDEHRAERFVPAVTRIGWLSEKRAATGVVHDVYSLEMSVVFCRRIEGNAIRNCGTVDAKPG